MTTRWRSTILGGGLGLYLVGLGCLTGAVLAQHDEAKNKFRSYLMRPEPDTPVGRESDDVPWTGPIRRVDEALARKNVNAAEQAWLDAFGAALKSRRWDGMVEAGDAYLRLGGLGGFSKAAEAKARQIYLAALFRARQQESLDGVLRTAEAFAALGDSELVNRCLRIAQSLAARARDAQARERVREVVDRLTNQTLGSVSLATGGEE